MIKIILPLSIAAVMIPLQAQNPTKDSTTGAAQNSNAEHKAKVHQSHEVSDLLQATSQARAAVSTRDKEDAMFHIEHALENAAIS
jgi:hypothetical protein